MTFDEAKDILTAVYKAMPKANRKRLYMAAKDGVRMSCGAAYFSNDGYG